MALSSSPNSDGINMPGKLRSLVQTQKLDIEINLKGHKKAYSTLDGIEGTAEITAAVNTHFDDIDIEFVGTSRTYVERLTTAAAASGRSEAFHQFLKLTQPGLQQHYPADCILKAGQTYKFPFLFVVPQQLLPRVCQHKTHNPAVRDAHLQLPPTLGDKGLGTGPDALDDMAPDMASVRYGIFARVSRTKTHDAETFKVSLASKAKRLRVTPAAAEQPPLDAGGAGSEYTMRKEKTLRKGVLKGKLGTLIMEASQPQSLHLQTFSNPEFRTTVMATVMLRFDPADEKAPPPRLGSLSTKMKVCTFFASTARHNFPSKTASLLDLSQGLHAEQINLSSRCVANVEWSKCDPAKPVTINRRDSALSLNAGDIPQPSATYGGKTFYTARVLVPITLPTKQTFVPTFHSCLISRRYQLKIELGLHSVVGQTLDLRVPIQISAEGSDGEQDSRQESEELADDVDDEVDDALDLFVARRTTRAQSDGAPRRARIGSQAPLYDAPPGYSPFATGLQGRQMSVPAY
ncbi:hypothetical protein LTR08_006232 [Meristemomyces frigidus]|nr:hypothetical protein LTR08_006232 [Meristemomyces frigidus]